MTLNAAIVGLGWWGKHILKQMAESKDLRFAVAVGSREAHRAVADEHGVAFTTNYEAALRDEEIQVVVLTTPHNLHAEQVLQAAAHGKHVFCEKPLALTVADATRCVVACRRAGVGLGIGHERRFEHAIAKLMALAKSGELGKVVHAEGNFSHDKLVGVSTDSWRFADKQISPVAMTGTGVHLTDLFLGLFGEASEAYATSPRVDGADSNTISLQLRFASGATAYMNSVLETPLYMRFAVFGSAGWAEVRNLAHPDARGTSTLEVKMANGEQRLITFDWNDSVRDNLEAFSRSLTAGAPYPIRMEQMVENVAVLSATAESLESGRPVSV
ncbi:Gfo/Idh/MocA family protein [Cupriavidus necator]|uniref:Gfo/Idh/MocA family protein n=1 Tax=Cupriavidus necator TaxID=106590 RepID=UPI0005B35E92|nr:Gfo/Idh/MocA family oxidoreductase [Cupriavidus necator]